MIRRALAAIVCIAPIVAHPGSLEGAPSRDPRLESAPSGAQVRRNRFLTWHPATPGQSLPPDTELGCDAGCTVRAADGSTLTLGQGTHITVGQATFVLFAGSGPAALGQSFELRDGSATLVVASDKKRPRTVVVAGPGGGTVAAQSGQARVVMTEGRMGVSCVTGAARVKLRGGVVNLRPGEVTGFSAKESTIVAKPVATAPLLKSTSGKLEFPQPLALALGGLMGRPGFAWEAVSGAKAYEVQVSADPRFESLVEQTRVAGSAQTHIVKGLPPGAYYGRVLALDADGLGSLPSQPVALRVVAIGSAERAAVDAGRQTVFLPAGSTLDIPNPETLEIAIDDSRFAPAPAAWTADGEPHVVRLRLKGNFGAQSQFRVEPGKPRADVRLTPAWARWPADPVNVSVTLVDATGQPDPAIVPQVQVLLGTEPVAVDWTRDGATLTARISPHALTGPAVIRVIVKDAGGATLGRSFLEIDRTPVRPPSLGSFLAGK